jgi:16S rRNA G1207 methylase RsmC
MLGFASWDGGEQTSRAVTDLIEGLQAFQPGRAIDLGCGAGL